MTDIKKLIKESLRNMLEAKSKTDSTMDNVFQTMFRIAKAQELFGPHSNTDDNVKKYFGSDTMGQGVYRVVFDSKGNIIPSENKEKAKDLIQHGKIGFDSKNAKYMAFNIMANRGIEHSNNTNGPLGSSNEPRDNFSISRKNLQSADDNAVIKTQGGRKLSKETEYLENNQKIASIIYGIKDEEFKQKMISMMTNHDLNGSIDVTYDVPGSPYSDAIIKAYLIYGDMILDFVVTNTKGFDAYTTFGDATSTEKFKNQNANTLKNHNFRMKYKELTGNEPSKREIDKFFDSGETDIDKYLQALGVGRTERSLVDPSTETGEQRKARMDAERAAKRAKILARKQKGGL